MTIPCDWWCLKLRTSCSIRRSGQQVWKYQRFAWHMAFVFVFCVPCALMSIVTRNKNTSTWPEKQITSHVQNKTQTQTTRTLISCVFTQNMKAHGPGNPKPRATTQGNEKTRGRTRTMHVQHKTQQHTRTGECTARTNSRPHAHTTRQNMEHEQSRPKAWAN